jgi:hypothetical protein
MTTQLIVRRVIQCTMKWLYKELLLIIMVSRKLREKSFVLNSINRSVL